jgi:hypothetical protein
MYIARKSLKISKEQPETIDRKRQTINLMSTRKDTKPKQWSTKDYTKNEAHEPHIKWENNDPQEVTQKTKDRVTRTPLKTGGERRCNGRSSSYFFSKRESVTIGAGTAWPSVASAFTAGF